jgi:hypothetical protein
MHLFALDGWLSSEKVALLFLALPIGAREVCVVLSYLVGWLAFVALDLLTRVRCPTRNPTLRAHPTQQHLTSPKRQRGNPYVVPSLALRACAGRLAGRIINCLRTHRHNQLSCP